MIFMEVMSKLDEKYEKYLAFIRELNRAGPADDEYELIAVYKALTAKYNLDRYPTPPIVLRRERAESHAARLGGIFASMEGRKPPCRA